LNNTHQSRVSWDFAKLNLHWGIFEKPAENFFFNTSGGFDKIKGALLFLGNAGTGDYRGWEADDRCYY